jgi:hypothetical protein
MGCNGGTPNMTSYKCFEDGGVRFTGVHSDVSKDTPVSKLILYASATPPLETDFQMSVILHMDVFLPPDALPPGVGKPIWSGDSGSTRLNPKGSTGLSINTEALPYDMTNAILKVNVTVTKIESCAERQLEPLS